MGLKLRLNLFYKVPPADIYGIYARYYAKRGLPLQQNGDEFWELVMHEQDNDWVVLSLDGGWEWKLRREVQLLVSKELSCPGFLIFVYDGDYWGYEFFAKGVVLDHFVQDPEEGGGCWFPDSSITGKPETLAAHLPWLVPREIAPYLVQKPPVSDDDTSYTYLEKVRKLNVPARPDDEFRRFDECAALDFLRLLGIRVELKDHWVTLLAPKWRSFWIRKD